ncbi:TIGR02301 family protein [Microvirga antarctica]|uniref:TIGR02301 family protein n=1 Tax=Microvirga antarctica TaxID=2819233 RepID=UPI001B31587A|nr:TIGR02301 family protein [Microvirga antarctica]
MRGRWRLVGVNPVALALIFLGSGLVVPGPASAQNFFERLFGLPPGQAPQQVAPRQQPQFRPPTQRRQPATPPAQRQAPAKEKAETVPVEPPPAPYEKDLLRLSEIMGSLALLRPICAAADGPEWSRRMQVLLEAEGTTPGRRERLAGAYNKGYQAFALTYRVCTPSAQEASARYLKEGERLARTISGRYGG